MSEMMREALTKWNAMSTAERMLPMNPSALKAAVVRGENKYPENGLVLRVFSRDLPRTGGPTDWRKGTWNQDYAWYSANELVSMLPADIAEGERAAVPMALVSRLARFNFIDNVCGQTSEFPSANVVSAQMDVKVLKVVGKVATIRYTGETKTERTGSWPIRGLGDPTAVPQRLGVEVKIFGTATYDTTRERFTSFEMLALGIRFGATQYNGRQDDPGPSPVGYYLTLGGKSPAERVAPSFFWAYGWR